MAKNETYLNSQYFLTIMNPFKKLLLKIPPVGKMYDDVQVYRKGYPPGHYYSPVVSPEEVTKHEGWIFDKDRNLDGITINEEEQAALLHKIAEDYADTIYLGNHHKGLRYYFDNNTFEYSDAIFLHHMIRQFCPKKIIEIGSGFSSAVMLDTNEFHFGNSIELIFIEPYPERLQGLMKAGDDKIVKLIPEKLQDVPLDFFRQLAAGDILFVDSTHVSKTGSDVNMIIFDILPILPKGVIIHFHDIFYPFEYPKEWVLGWSGFGWNEIYLLRAFLTNNDQYKIILFNTYLEHSREEWFKQNMPLCLKDRGGSLWIQKM
jgi:hypothetical protein